MFMTWRDTVAMLQFRATTESRTNRILNHCCLLECHLELYYAWLTCSTKTKKQKRSEREVVQVCLCISQFVGVVLISWERDLTNICHQRIVQEKLTDEWQKNSTSKQNIVTIVLTNVTQLNVSHQKHVNYLNFAWASIISVITQVLVYYQLNFSHTMTFVELTTSQTKILK